MVKSFTLDVGAGLSTVYDWSVGGLKPADPLAFQGQGNTTDVAPLFEEPRGEIRTEDELATVPLPRFAEQLQQGRVGRYLLLGMPAAPDSAVGVREVVNALLIAEWGTECVALVCAHRRPDDAADWDRWHDLLDIRDREGLTPDEQVEYDRFAKVVAKLDAEDAAVSAPAVEALVKKHERVLASIEQLTKAVRAAADRV